MPKPYAGSKASDLNVPRASRLPENRAILYAKTADIPGVLTVVDASEKVAIWYAQSAIISRVPTVVGMPENRAILYVNPVNIPATIY